MSDESIRQLTASIILNTYRNHCDKYNTLDELIKQYNEILNKITPKIDIKLLSNEEKINYFIDSNTGKICK